MSDASGKRILKSSSGVMLATLLSRIMGLGRVMLEAGVLGGGALAGAWQMAFMVPNLFRRLLGEGALGTALVPMLSHELVNNGKTSARRMLTVVTAASGLVLAVLCILTGTVSVLATAFVTRPDSILILKLIPVLIPYALFICLIGIFSSAMNCVRMFFLPAMLSLLLNIFIIAALLWICPAHKGDDYAMLSVLAQAVVWSGVAELLLMIPILYSAGLGFDFSRETWRCLKTLRELWFLMLPGLIGAGALQLSFIADRLLAFWLGPFAVPALTYPDRLVFLPISVFALSLGGVVLPKMSRSAARGDSVTLVDTMFFGLRNLMFMCIPVAIFMLVFRNEILRAVYMRGAFGERELAECSWSMLFYCAGIPFFSSIKIVVTGFQSRKDMKTPMIVSLICIAVNIILNLILMFPLKQGGIVLATVISSVLNNSILIVLLRRDLGRELPLKPLAMSSAAATAVSLGLCGAFSFAYPWIRSLATLPAFLPADLFPLAVCGSAFLMIYFLIMRMGGNREAAGIISMLTRRKG